MIIPGDTSGSEVLPSTEDIIKPVYNDMANASWAETAVNALTEKGVIAGDGNGNFRPNDTIKREEFAKMLVVAINALDENAKSPFTDMDKDAWYYKYVSSAYELGIVSGVSETKFGIGRNITRQEMAVMIMQALKNYKDIQDEREDVGFSDEADIDEWAKEAVSKLYRAGIMSGSGDGNFAPKNVATRAQAAVVVYNLIK